MAQSKEDIRRRLIWSAMTLGDFSGWRDACEDAMHAGMTQQEVDRILAVYHPFNVDDWRNSS